MNLPPFFPGAFDSVIAANGVRLSWAKAQVCPCTYQGYDTGGYQIDGGGVETCNSCHGLGVYWRAFSDPFMGLVTFAAFTPSPSEPGTQVNEKWGPLGGGTPMVTLSYTANPTAWAEASTYDQIVIIDSITRYSAVLRVGIQESLPYVNNLSVPPIGAAMIWDPLKMVATLPTSYSVSGSTVQLPSSYEYGTPYNVEFYASQTYVLYKPAGGLPHARPFGGGVANYPRRFTASNLDLWLRQRAGNATPPTWPAPGT
jgi:hypothetical protein